MKRSLAQRAALHISMVLWRWARRYPLPIARVVHIKDRPSWWNMPGSVEALSAGIVISFQLACLIYLFSH